MTFKPADRDAMLAELKRDDTTVDLEPGSQWSVNGRMPIGEGTTLVGNGAIMVAAGGSRLWVEKPGVTIRDLSGFGYFTLYAYAGNLTVEDVLIRHTLPGSNDYLDLGKSGGATGAFMVWGAGGKTIRNLAFRRCVAEMTYHHGFSLNLANGNEGGGYADVLYESCTSRGAGAVPVRDPRNLWACGFDIPDAGDIAQMIVRDCLAEDPVQDGFHLDGSWDGHRQTVDQVLFERCTARACGRRCPEQSVEKFRTGFYMHAGKLVDCHSNDCAGAGFGFPNEWADSLVVDGCSDNGSQYGLILNYAAPGARVRFTSKAAKVRAFVGQGGHGGGTLDLTIIDPPAIAATFGRALRIDYIDCPNHAAQQASKYDTFGYTLDGSRIILRSEDGLKYETWKTSHITGGGPTFKPVAPDAGTADPDTAIDDITPPPIVLPPDEGDLGSFLVGPYHTILAEVASAGRSKPVQEVPDELRPYFKVGRRYTPEGL